MKDPLCRRSAKAPHGASGILGETNEILSPREMGQGGVLSAGIAGGFYDDSGLLEISQSAEEELMTWLYSHWR